MNPDLIKALIASESGFDPKILANKKNGNSARGLMQITNNTRKILGDEHGELKEHYLTITREDLNDPGVNICAGVRWLFQKRILASKKLKRPASWLEAVYEYKGASTVPKKRADEIMEKFFWHLEKHKKMFQVVGTVVFIVASTIAMACATAQTKSLETFKQKYPYGLLGEDYGILVESDLRKNTEIAEPGPFPNQVGNYPYWQCFAVKDISIECESTGFDESEKAELAILAGVVKTNTIKHEYLSRRAFPMKGCKKYESDWTSISKRQSHACISGPFGRFDNKGEMGRKTAYWTFDKVKTRNGCISYFEGACDL